MNITKDQIQTILDTLKDMPETSQKPIRDALMITSENDWHDLVHSSLDGYVDTEKDHHTWYREDELADEGYFHESVISAMAVNDIEGLCKTLSREKVPQTIISIDTLFNLYTKGELPKIEKDLVEAILKDQGML